MKLYVVIESWETKHIPKLFEIEVVEKPKSYTLVNNEDRWKVGYVSRVNKSAIGEIHYNANICIGLTAEEAVKGFREHCQKGIAKHEEELAALKKQLVALDEIEGNTLSVPHA